MPISKSAKKALRVAEHKTSLNRHRKEITKEAIKQATTPETLSKGIAAIDKAAKWGIIHPNKANRLKSRLSKSVSEEAPKKTKVIKIVKAKKVSAKTRKTKKA
jgi:ribosomal protein S20